MLLKERVVVLLRCVLPLQELLVQHSCLLLQTLECRHVLLSNAQGFRHGTRRHTARRDCVPDGRRRRSRGHRRHGSRNCSGRGHGRWGKGAHLGRHRGFSGCALALRGRNCLGLVALHRFSLASPDIGSSDLVRESRSAG